MPTYYNVGEAPVNSRTGAEPINQMAIFNGYTEIKQIQYSGFLPPVSRGKRKRITSFSHRSRKNLLKQIFCLSEYPSLFVTLTYPRFFPADLKEWKRHLDNFRREVKRKFPDAWFYWKLEPQKRGAPYYHLIGDLDKPVPITLLRQYLSEVWYRVCGAYDPKHLRAGVQADYVNDSLGKMKSYVCKYVAKVDENENLDIWATQGRFWGKIGEKNMPPRLAYVVNINSGDYYKLKRAIRKWLKRLSPSSREYSSRLKSIPSFHILASGREMKRLFEFVTGSSVPPLTPIEFVPLAKLERPIYD